MIVVLTTLARLVLAWACPGFVGGDDVEILEAGFRSATGLDFSPWPIRNLLLPEGLVAPALRFAGLCGVHDPTRLVFVGRLPFVLLASVNILLLFLLGRRLGLDEGLAVAAAGLYAFHWLPLGYGATTYPRTVSVTCLLGAALLSLAERARTTRLVAAGGLVAVAFACRYSEIVFLPPLILLAAVPPGTRRQRLGSSLLVAAGFGCGALLTVGAVDWATWGRPFASLAAFARYTLSEGASSSRVASQPPWWYLQRLPFWLPFTLLPVLALTVRSRRWWPVWGWVLLPMVTLSVIHHKELRYLQGVLPAVMLLAAAGFGSLGRRARPAVVLTLAAASILWGLLGLRFLTRTTGPAVRAARFLVSEGPGEAVVLSQAWAYGHRLLLGNGVEVRDVATPPTIEMLAAATPGARWVAVYRSDLRSNPALRARLQADGFVETGDFTWGRARPVSLWRRDTTGVSERRESAPPPLPAPPRLPAST